MVDQEKRSVINGRVLIGLIIIAAGVIMMLDEFGFYLGISVWELWPVILIVIGLNHLVQPKENQQRFNGLILLGVGILFLLGNLDIIYIRLSLFWPIIIVIIGIALIRHGLFSKEDKPYDVDFINLSFLMGGGDFKFTSRQLKGGKISAIMGGCTVDLKQADFIGDELVIDTFAMWGGIEIRVPDNWEVNLQGSPILGGMDNKTGYYNSESESRKKLTIKGFVIMGGIEVKN